MEINPTWYTNVHVLGESVITEYIDFNTKEIQITETVTGDTRVFEDLRLPRLGHVDTDVYVKNVLTKSIRVLHGTNILGTTEYSLFTGKVLSEKTEDIKTGKFISEVTYLYHKGFLTEKSSKDSRGLRSGVTEYFDAKGNLIKKTEFKDGVPHGFNVDYRDEGFPVSSCRNNNLGEPEEIRRFSKTGLESK